MNDNSISMRKIEHLRHCVHSDVSSKVSAGFNRIRLPHKSMPEVALNDIDTSIRFLGHELLAPIFVTGMTGGASGTLKINKEIAAACERYGLGFGVGSQRAAIEHPELSKTYKVRDVFKGLLFANLGLVQFSEGYGLTEAEKAMSMIDADYLAVHLNPAQEACQEEGNTNFKGGISNLKKIADEFPIVVKETGAGISGDMAKKIKSAGAKAIDVSGLGGTSWSYIESLRVKDKRNRIYGETFRDWGIPTVDSIIASRKVKLPMIGSGGVRSGIDIAKTIALGADCAGFALPVLTAVFKKRLDNFFERVIKELKISMFLTGCGKVEDLKSLKYEVID